MYDPVLLDRLESLPARAFEDVVWRHMFAGLDPSRVNSRGARWNPPGVAAIYTSLERDTAIAEGDFAIASQPLRPRATRQIHTIRLNLERVLDLTDRVLLVELGVSESDLEGRDQTSCRTLGGAAYWLGHDGILVPSARAPGLNLVAFADRMNIDVALEVLDTEEVD